jgi:hypothetical protein
MIACPVHKDILKSVLLKRKILGINVRLAILL